MRRLLIVLAAASCGDSTKMVQTIQDMSMVMLADLSVKGDLAVPPGADLSQLPDLKPPPTGDLAHVAGQVPDPGAGDPIALFPWPDNEPNNTPDTAVPVGTATSTTIRPWFDAGPNKIGGTDTHDYFVFKSSGTGGTFSFGMSWSSGTNLADAALYKVVAGVQQTPAVQTWVSTSTAGEESSGPLPSKDVTMEADTVYLFEITAVDAPAATDLYA